MAKGHAEEKSMQETILLICEELLDEARRIANSDKSTPLLAGENTAESFDSKADMETKDHRPSLHKIHEQRNSQRLFMVKPFTEIHEDPEGTI